MSQFYRVSNPDGLIQHMLDSMTLIYQKSSGMTHVVADPVPAILDVMAEDALSAEAVAERLADRYDLEQSGDAADIVLARLVELCTLGLVEKV